MNKRQRIFGVLIWLTGAIAVVGLGISSTGNGDGGAPSIASDVSSWVTGRSRDYYAESSNYVLLFTGDPIFLQQPDGAWRQVGFVHDHFGAVTREAWTHEAVVTLYDLKILEQYPNGFSLEVHLASSSLDQVMTTLLTPDKQQEIAKIIAKDWSKHRDELLEKLNPVIQSSLTRAAASIESQLPGIMQAQRPAFARVADRYQSTIVKDQIVPLVRQEILPIVQEEIRPLARELGKQLWDKVSLWSFTWRYLYDVSPLPEKNALQNEFNRFITDEVTPAIAARTDEFVAVTERIVSRVSRNDKVRAVIKENLRRFASDPELQAIVWQVIQESVLQNMELRQNLTTYWESDEVRQMLDIAATKFEPTARAIGDAIVGARTDGITAEFSRVLRSQILMKDRRWLTIVSKTDLSGPPRSEHASDWKHLPQLNLIPASTTMDFPLEFEGTLQSPLTPIEKPAE